VSATAGTPYRSPIAGFVNALARHAIRGLDARIRELEAVLAAATELSRAEATARDFADSDRSGYIDRTGLEADRA
jgi:hypothetical protein